MPTNKELTFSMQPQEQDEWCWAANAASISDFYGGGSAWTQCKVACSTLGRNDCCTAPYPNLCNYAYYLDQALTITGNFKGPVVNQALPANDIMTQIDVGNVIGVRIGWSAGGGHFVSIYGYNSTAGALYICRGSNLWSIFYKS